VQSPSLEWFAVFKSSVSSVESAEQCRETSVKKLHKNVDYVKEIVFLNKRITICEVTDMLGFHLGWFREL
jgi:hypothetical protein